MNLCPNAPNGPRDCGMVAVQVDEAGNRWTCTACYLGPDRVDRLSADTAEAHSRTERSQDQRLTGSMA